MLKMSRRVAVAVSALWFSAPAWSQPFAEWHEEARKLLDKELVVAGTPDRAHVGVPPYPGAKLVYPAQEAEEGESCEMVLVSKDSIADVKAFYQKATHGRYVHEPIDLSILGLASKDYYLLRSKEDMREGIAIDVSDVPGYQTQIFIGFRGRGGYQCPVSEPIPDDEE